MVRFFRSFLMLWLLAAVVSAQAQSSETAFPLDPLSKTEIQAAVETLRAAGKTSPDSLFAHLSLREPPKAEVLNFTPGSPLRREAFAILYDRAKNQTFEGIVDIPGKRVVSWKEIPGVQARTMLEDFLLGETIVRADPGWQAAMKKRGITDLKKIVMDPWPAGFYGIKEENDHDRRVNTVFYYKPDASIENYYANPIEGHVAHVNLTKRRVDRLVETDAPPLHVQAAEFNGKNTGELREAAKPLVITQPQGVSFEVKGQEVRWQNWRFRFAMHPREGLVLYTVGYEDKGILRSILYRASLSEMVVPYSDPGENAYFKNVFDMGEHDLAWMANSLIPEADAPANAVFFNATLTGERGIPHELPRAIALYERDGGILWRHEGHSVRARDLVLACLLTVGNYDYGFSWIFHQDGTLEQETLLTGIMTTKGVARANDLVRMHDGNTTGHLVMPYTEATHHQHFFNFRLDMDVDGVKNSLVEQNTEPIASGKENPYGNAFRTTETPLKRERDAQRTLNLASNRTWKVIAPSALNALGQPTGYALLSGANTIPFAQPTAWFRKRAGFLSAHLWATQNDPTQQHAAGPYPNQSHGGEGLPDWIRANRSLEGEDLVLWYTMGLTHNPRPEEWPVMATHRLGFKLSPSGFFTRNPALDVPQGGG